MGFRNERGEGAYPDSSVKGTIPLGPIVSLHAMTAKLSRNPVFHLELLIRSFPKARLIGSWYFYPIASALRCCVLGLCLSTS